MKRLVVSACGASLLANLEKRLRTSGFKGLHGFTQTLGMVFTDGTSAVLSAWGEILWGKFTETHYKKQLYPSPIPDIVLSKNFHKDLESWNGDKHVLWSVNQRLDDLAQYLLSGQKTCLKRLDFKSVTGDLPKKRAVPTNSTHGQRRGATGDTAVPWRTANSRLSIWIGAPDTRRWS